VRSVRFATLDAGQIRDFWASQAAEHGSSHRASWSDRGAIELEIGAIGSRLQPGSDVLDVGCANGFSSRRYVEDRGITLTGVDFVPEMIEAAEESLSDAPAALRQRVRFVVGDVRALDFPSASFDAVISTRVIINLATDEEQRTALGECTRVLRPGGLFLLSEAIRQGWQRLNSLRTQWGLDAIPMPDFNRYLDEDQVRATLQPVATLEETVDFASSYYVATRFLKPLLVKATNAAVDVADPEAEFNRWAAKLPPAGDYGTQKLLVFRKR